MNSYNMRDAQSEVIAKSFNKYLKMAGDKLDQTTLNEQGSVFSDILNSDCSDISKRWVICQLIEMDVYEIYVAGLFS